MPEISNQPEAAGGDPNAIVVTRTFDAPAELVFRAWTDPEQMKQWWGPHGFSIPHCTMDPRVGGKLHYCMRSPDGTDFWAGGVYREVVPNERLVLSDYFSNEQGEVISPSAYGMPEWPEEMTIAVTFVEEDGKTTVTMRQYAATPLPTAGRDGAHQGWTEQFEKLAKFLGGAR